MQNDHSDCNGCLHVSVVDNQSMMQISLHHEHTHLPYENIKLPEHWKEFTKNDLTMTPGKVCFCVYYIYYCLGSVVLDLAAYDGN